MKINPSTHFRYDIVNQQLIKIVIQIHAVLIHFDLLDNFS